LIYLMEQERERRRGTHDHPGKERGPPRGIGYLTKQSHPIVSCSRKKRKKEGLAGSRQTDTVIVAATPAARATYGALEERGKQKWPLDLSNSGEIRGPRQRQTKKEKRKKKSTPGFLPTRGGGILREEGEKGVNLQLPKKEKRGRNGKKRTSHLLHP